MSPPVYIDLDGDRMVNQINANLQRMLQGPLEGTVRTVETSMDAIKTVLSDAVNGVLQNVNEIRVLIQDTVKLLQPFLILLLISISLSFLASAWRKTQREPERPIVLLVLPAEAMQILGRPSDEIRLIGQD
ncbi:hypothetical protein BDZ97DRAFT_2083574, partial [Flammula alnicola]